MLRVGRQSSDVVAGILGRNLLGSRGESGKMLSYDTIGAAEGTVQNTGERSMPVARPHMDVTLQDFWSQYYEPEILPTLKVSGRKTYTSLFKNHLLPYFGARRLAEIQRVEVQRFIALKQSQGKSTETLSHLRNLLSALFATAISWGMVEANPASGVKLPPAERRRESRILPPDEIRRLLGALPEPSRTISGPGIGTGLRIGELLGLKGVTLTLSGAFSPFGATSIGARWTLPKRREVSDWFRWLRP